VCAAIALTYEATLPRLDEALARAQVVLPNYNTYCILLILTHTSDSSMAHSEQSAEARKHGQRLAAFQIAAMTLDKCSGTPTRCTVPS
jgi:hypothetical protein